MEEDWILHVARLAHLELTPEEAKAFGKQLPRIRKLFDALASLPGQAEEIPPLPTPLREDTPKGLGVDWKDLLSQAPEKENGYIKVPPVLDETP